MSLDSPSASADKLPALSPLQKSIRLEQIGIVLFTTLASLSLWSWFYLSAFWLEQVLGSEPQAPYPTAMALVSVGLFCLFQFVSNLQRKKGAEKLSRFFYQGLFDELLHKRWALIRSKPVTAWQDVSFRHLPAIESYLLDYQSQVKLVALMPVFVMALVFPLSWLAALILLLTLPLIPLFMWLVGLGAAAIQKKHINSLNRLGRFFSDRVAGQSSVRLMRQTHDQLKQFKGVSEQLNQRLAKVIRMAFMSSSVLDFFSTVSMALLAVFIGFSLLGEITFGFWVTQPGLHESLFILLISPGFFAELKKLGRLYHVKAEAIASVSEWQHTLSWLTRKHKQNQEKMLNRFSGLSIKNATINGYEGSPLLSIASLSLNAGDCVHLQGVSGSGKSVLLDALAGLRTFASGELQLNHSPAKNFSAMLSNTFYLSQTPVFFNGTLEANLGLGEHSQQAVENAIAKVHMADWLAEQPLGLQTLFDDDLCLSGGQRQKLAIARIILFDLPLLLLDEPLAHLSTQEQIELTRLLEKITRQRASVWVSHKALPEQLFSRIWLAEPEQGIREVVCEPN